MCIINKEVKNACVNLPVLLNGALQNGSDESEPDITKSSRLFTFEIPVKWKWNTRIISTKLFLLSFKYIKQIQTWIQMKALNLP